MKFADDYIFQAKFLDEFQMRNFVFKLEGVRPNLVHLKDS
tara:strand:+ start:291 stop:410 length:120 start_codon:yes stop_codon:yes gene_type:complete